MLELVISGGQTGVDQAALHAAEACGIPTGGWAPKGWLTLDGPQPILGSRWSLRECPCQGYMARTYENALMGDITVQIAFDFLSPGERCTTRALQIYGKKSVRVDLREDPPVAPHQVATEILYYGPSTLNVAGNSEQTAPGIFKYAKLFLIEVFTLVKQGEAQLICIRKF